MISYQIACIDHGNPISDPHSLVMIRVTQHLSQDYSESDPLDGDHQRSMIADSTAHTVENQFPWARDVC